MKCKCTICSDERDLDGIPLDGPGHPDMTMVGAWDDAQATDHAYNLYVCDACGRICKEDVWEHRGRRWLSLDGTLTVEGTDDDES